MQLFYYCNILLSGCSLCLLFSKTGQIHVYFQNEINPQNLKFQINISEKVGSLDFSKGGFMFL